MTLFTAFFIVLGALFSFIAALGILKFPSFYMRVQAASKASTLGVIFMFIGLAPYFATSGVYFKSVLVVLFLLITIPAGTHALVKSRYMRTHKSYPTISEDKIDKT